MLAIWVSEWFVNVIVEPGGCANWSSSPCLHGRSPERLGDLPVSQTEVIAKDLESRTLSEISSAPSPCVAWAQTARLLGTRQTRLLQHMLACLDLQEM